MSICAWVRVGFPFLFGGTFIEGLRGDFETQAAIIFPFLFGGTFIEGGSVVEEESLRQWISLPFRRDFH